MRNNCNKMPLNSGAHMYSIWPYAPTNDNFPPGYVVKVQRKGWMNGEHMSAWLKKIVLPYTKKAMILLVLNSFSAHTDAPVLCLLPKTTLIDLAVILGGFYILYRAHLDIDLISARASALIPQSKYFNSHQKKALQKP